MRSNDLEIAIKKEQIENNFDEFLEQQRLNKKFFDTEREVLSMLICGKDSKQKHIFQHLRKDMFTSMLNREIFEMVQDQIKRHGFGRVNPDNLIDDYQAKKFKNAVFETLLIMQYEFITDATCDYHLRVLIDRWINRLYTENRTQEGSEEIKKIIEPYLLKEDISRLSTGSETLLDDYDKQANKFVKTGYSSIDDVIGSLHAGDVAILAGATGMGKTCMALNLVTNVARQGKKVLLFSFEMSIKQLQNRIISAETGISSNAIRECSMTQGQLNKYAAYINSDEFTNMNIDISADYNSSISQVEEKVRQSNADLVCIDYLGLIGTDHTTPSSYEKFSEISRRIKLLAVETDKPFIVLHQLSRASKERSDKRPILSDLRDSGKIEQDADFVFFVYRPAYYNEQADKTELQFRVAKNRHGRIDDVKLRFNASTQKITEVKSYVKDTWAKQLVSYLE